MTDAQFARDWSELLDRLDRHGASGQLSPDVASLADLMDTYRVPGISDVTGRYLLRDNYPIDITAADGRLTLVAVGQPSAVLLPLPNGHYRHPGFDLEISFQRAGEESYTMELWQEGITQTASRRSTVT